MSEMSKSEERPVSPPLQKKEPKQHPCHMCPYVTSRKDNLRRHFNSFHLEKVEVEPVLDPVPEVLDPVPEVSELQLLKEELAKLRSEFELFVSKCSAPVSAPVSAQEAPKPKPKRKSKANKPVVEVADSSDELKEEVI